MQPQVKNSFKKEVHYFDKNYDKPINWYKQYFSLKFAVNDSIMVGEATPNYLYHPYVAGRIKKTIPDVKMIVLLRNPVERVISQYFQAVRKNVEKLPQIQSPYGDDFVEQLKPFWKNIEKATFLGGEPFLIKLYYKIWDEIIENNPEINILIVSNGTILNDKIKELLTKGKFYFALSIDSFKKDTYEKIRRNAIFEKTMSNFEYFYQYSKENNRWITVNIYPMQQNWKEIPDMISFLNKREVNAFFNMVDFPSSHSLRGLDSEQILQVYNYFNTAKIANLDNEVSLQNDKMFKALILQTKI
ncbi:MAG: radical SAM protein, partial [Bacteroidales bacterium]